MIRLGQPPTTIPIRPFSFSKKSENDCGEIIFHDTGDILEVSYLEGLHELQKMIQKYSISPKNDLSL